jgi:hypothetical protein
MKKQYLIYTHKNGGFEKRRCDKDVRIVIGKGKCLKCELNQGLGKDIDGEFVYCTYLSK